MNELKLNVVDHTAVSPSATAGKKAYAKAASDPVAGSDSGKSLPVGTEKVAELNKDQVREAISRINEYVQQTERTLDFQLDEDSGKTIIRVYDRASSELIRQIPSELALELAQKLNDEEPSLLFSAQV
ncbi:MULTISPECIES: flagellar protein FlaG [unclassified Thalassolituus]|jgi:flagellar protein FlaG|uniref:flagellar protein FlaG n=1 Tax=Oceanospirillaceae TaxID=135620 RepID=UPI001197FB00|nr:MULTISPECIES: flagellar protein FlaG [unclassified Thalassolituus]MBU2040013.1 flagellar protein FlaG [Gammaproteobacteria bacterium]MCA6061900.1 flagellar protein FlaG [Thalassolituus sp. ST750PaO-4]TVV45333.1 flagellar protein FlaG [Thalassolituus sp. C2-1]